MGHFQKREMPTKREHVDRLAMVRMFDGHEDNLRVCGQLFVSWTGRTVGGWLVISGSGGEPNLQAKQHWFDKNENKFYHAYFDLDCSLNLYSEDKDIDPKRAAFIRRMTEKWESEWPSSGQKVVTIHTYYVDLVIYKIQNEPPLSMPNLRAAGHQQYDIILSISNETPDTGADYPKTPYADCPSCGDPVPPRSWRWLSRSSQSTWTLGRSMAELHCANCDLWFQVPAESLKFAHILWNYDSRRYMRASSAAR